MKQENEYKLGHGHDVASHESHLFLFFSVVIKLFIQHLITLYNLLDIPRGTYQIHNDLVFLLKIHIYPCFDIFCHHCCCCSCQLQQLSLCVLFQFVIFSVPQLSPTLPLSHFPFRLYANFHLFGNTEQLHDIRDCIMQVLHTYIRRHSNTRIRILHTFVSMQWHIIALPSPSHPCIHRRGDFGKTELNSLL